MKIIVRAKPKAKEEKVELLSQSSLNFGSGKEELPVYKVSVKEPPVAGRANKAIIEALAKYFDKFPFQIHLISGQTLKQKVFEIN